MSSNSISSGSKRSRSPSSPDSDERPKSYPKTNLQFFVSTISTDRPTVVIRANSDESIASVLARIESLIGIPSNQQRLIYQGKQLREENTLAQSNVQNDVVLHLVGRLLSSKKGGKVEHIRGIINRACPRCKSHRAMSTQKANMERAMKASAKALNKLQLKDD